MTRPALVPLCMLGIVLLPSLALGAGVVRRFALVTAANDGGPDRPRLQYALTDAERFARVIGELGGVSPSDAVVLKQPKLKELDDALDLLESRVSEARRAAGGGINLSGTGEVVSTDLRQTSATLVLGEHLEGRFFVHDAKQELVVELFKPYGRRVELGVEPGRYEVRVEREAAALLAEPTVAEGARVVLDPTQFTPTTPEPALARGGVERPPFAVTGRHRIQLHIGSWQVSGASSTPRVAAGTDAFDFATGLEYQRFLREDLALTFGPRVMASTSDTVSTNGVSSGSLSIVSLPLGVRWNPMKGELHTRSVKPYLAAGLGPVIGASSAGGVDQSGAFAGSRTRATVGGNFGAGVDFLLGRHFTLGVEGGYQWMSDFSDPIGARDNYSGFQFGVNIGWLFGKGGAPIE